MSDVGKLSLGVPFEPALLHTVEEAAESQRIGRTLAYALVRRHEPSDGGRQGLPAIRRGNCLRVPRWALLELGLNARTVPLGELTPSGNDARRALDAELTRINQLGREADPEPEQSAPRVVQLSGQARIRRAVRPRSGEQLHLLPPS